MSNTHPQIAGQVSTPANSHMENFRISVTIHHLNDPSTNKIKTSPEWDGSIAIKELIHSFDQLYSCWHLCQYICVYPYGPNAMFIATEAYTTTIALSTDLYPNGVVPVSAFQSISHDILVALQCLQRAGIHDTPIHSGNLYAVAHRVKVGNFATGRLQAHGLHTEILMDSLYSYLYGQFPLILGLDPSQKTLFSLGIVLLQLLSPSAFECLEPSALGDAVEFVLQILRSRLLPVNEHKEALSSMLSPVFVSAITPVLERLVQKDAFADFLICLLALPSRPTDCGSLLSHSFLQITLPPPDNLFDGTVFSKLSFPQIFHLYSVSEGSLERILRRRGLFVPQPPIDQIPSIIQADNQDFYINMPSILAVNTTQPFLLSITTLQACLNRLVSIDTEQIHIDCNFYISQATHCIFREDLMLAEFPSSDLGLAPISKFTQQQLHTPSNLQHLKEFYDTHRWAVHLQLRRKQTNMILAENDTEYQYYRILLFTYLLDRFPPSMQDILLEAAIDIPQVLRAQVWAALLGIVDSPCGKALYTKNVRPPADEVIVKQIMVDVPRCHQYDRNLSSLTGKDRLKRVLYAWVNNNPSMQYWQGLDSITAPFLRLNFYKEHIAFMCINNLILLFLSPIVSSKTSAPLEKVLVDFASKLEFNDPQLCIYFCHENFLPHLYAVPWLITLFAHIFSIDQLFYLWDTMLCLGPDFPLFIGIAFLIGARADLLKMNMEELIHLFSDLPALNIYNMIDSAVLLFRSTPPSLYSSLSLLSFDGMDCSGNIMHQYATLGSHADYIKMLSHSLVIDSRSTQNKEKHLVGSVFHKGTSSAVYEAIRPKSAYFTIIGVDATDHGRELYAGFIIDNIAHVSLFVPGDQDCVSIFCTCQTKTISIRDKTVELICCIDFNSRVGFDL